MGQKKYPPIDKEDFRVILRAIFGAPVRTAGDHEYYQGRVGGKYAHAQLDEGRDPVFDTVLKMTIANCNVSREQFYGLCKRTAKKIGCPYLKAGLPE